MKLLKALRRSPAALPPAPVVVMPATHAASVHGRTLILPRTRGAYIAVQYAKHAHPSHKHHHAAPQG